MTWDNCARTNGEITIFKRENKERKKDLDQQKCTCMSSPSSPSTRLGTSNRWTICPNGHKTDNSVLGGW